MAAQPPASETEPVKKPLCFVIGPIGQEGTLERKHADLLLHTLVKHVLEAAEFGYQVKRPDEDADPGMIGDRMVTDIIHADLVVADLTDLNPNAFYELGIRHSTEKPTIHLAKAGTKLPFDNLAHRTIFVDLTEWRSTEVARAHLAASARAIKAPEYRVSNPITQANASFKMRESADPQDRVIAGLQERLAVIERRLEPTPEARSDGNRPRHLSIVSELYRELYELLKTEETADPSITEGRAFLKQALTTAELRGLKGFEAEGPPDGWTIMFPGEGMIGMSGRKLYVTEFSRRGVIP